jgi:hypothetical protein
MGSSSYCLLCSYYECLLSWVEPKQKVLIHILKIVKEQNCFQFDQQYYKQTKGSAMGVPTFAVLTKTYI